jgi:hypothetical protein
VRREDQPGRNLLTRLCFREGREVFGTMSPSRGKERIVYRYSIIAGRQVFVLFRRTHTRRVLWLIVHIIFIVGGHEPWPGLSVNEFEAKPRAAGAIVLRSVLTSALLVVLLARAQPGAVPRRFAPVDIEFNFGEYRDERG